MSINKNGRDSRIKEIELELDRLCSNQQAAASNIYGYDGGWNSPRMRVFIASRLCSYQERCTELEEQLKFEKAVGERVVKVFKDAVGSEKPRS